jgi:hypothetical protein
MHIWYIADTVTNLKFMFEFLQLLMQLWIVQFCRHLGVKEGVTLGD